MITVASKSILNPEQMKDKAVRGSHCMEVHLAGELEEHTPEEFFAICEESGCFDLMQIFSIHSPLYSGQHNGDTLVERVADFPKLLATFQFAEMVARRQGRPMRVVVHAGTNSRILESLGILSQTVRRVRNLLDWHPYVSLSIENHVGCDYGMDSATLTPMSTVCLVEGKPELANCGLVQAIDHPRCKTLLDTVHLTMLERWLRAQGGFFEDERIVSAANGFVDAAIEQANGTLEHIHLAKAISHGNGPALHGQPFFPDSEEDVKYVRSFLQRAMEVSDDLLLVIETYEDDYLESENFSATLETVRSVLDDLGADYRF